MEKKYEVVSIEKARQRLGKMGEEMSDNQINDLLATLRLLCSKTIDGVIEKNHSHIEYSDEY